MARSLPSSIAISSNLFLLLITFSILVISAFLSNQTQIFSILFKNIYDDTLSDEGGKIPIMGAVGPESLAFDPSGGGPYTGVSDGRIIKWVHEQQRWVDFAITSPEREGCGGSDNHVERETVCGRPLGLRFNERSGDLYIADAYMGLLVVGPKGGLAQQVVTEAQGISLGFTNSLDIDPTTGVVYFTDSSTRYHRRNYLSVIVSGDNTGRLMKYDPNTNETKVLLHNLTFPNGVSLSKDGDFLLVSDTTNCQILKYWLKDMKSGQLEVLTRVMGFPDNIKRNEKGEYWVGVHGKRGVFSEWVLSKRWIGNALVNLPFDITKVYSYVSKWRGVGLGVRISENGEILEVLENKRKNGWKCVSEVYEREGVLWIGSIKMPFVGIVERGVTKKIDV